jgi:glycosyltransferase involved in cell wall biosynthesis
MRIAIITDAWRPQVNGVVTTLEQTSQELRKLGHDVQLLTPQSFNTLPCPTYPSIRLAVLPSRGVSRILNEYQPDAIHIATEGPLGQAGRRWCLKNHFPFTSSYHTQFPEYIRLRAPIPTRWTYAWLRRFHGAAELTMTPTESQRHVLLQQGFRNVVIWSRGVDTELFKPYERDLLMLPRPVSMYMGRVAVEKNIEAFLCLDLPGTKVVVGDGPDLEVLKRRYPQVVFSGVKRGGVLARHLASADVFVFPSLTDTFGIVMLEAMAAGLPIAAFPVTGPQDVVEQGVTGCLHVDLKQAILQALQLDGQACIDYARKQSWQRCSAAFLSYLKPVNRDVNKAC